ncbi:MAG: hypothetical protein GTN81_05700 [Proteobacteria bacterium]|nr:hypothetical protein [Pseudomonadota bacterium]
MRSKTALMIALAVLVISGCVSVSWAGQPRVGPVEDIVDLVVLRPLGCVAIVAGTGVFLLTLPFTYPTRNVEKAADRFVKAPFRYTFLRPFPDRDL